MHAKASPALASGYDSIMGRTTVQFGSGTAVSRRARDRLSTGPANATAMTTVMQIEEMLAGAHAFQLVEVDHVFTAKG